MYNMRYMYMYNDCVRKHLRHIVAFIALLEVDLEPSRPVRVILQSFENQLVMRKLLHTFALVLLCTAAVGQESKPVG